MHGPPLQHPLLLLRCSSFRATLQGRLVRAPRESIPRGSSWTLPEGPAVGPRSASLPPSLQSALGAAAATAQSTSSHCSHLVLWLRSLQRRRALDRSQVKG